MHPEQSFDMFVCVNLRLTPTRAKSYRTIIIKREWEMCYNFRKHSMKYTRSVLDAGLSLAVVPFQIQHGLYVLLNMLHVFSCSRGRLPVSILKQNVIYTFCHANPFYFFARNCFLQGKPCHWYHCPSGRQKSFSLIEKKKSVL